MAVIRKTDYEQEIEGEHGGTDIEVLLATRVYREQKSYGDIAAEWKICASTVQRWLSKRGMNKAQSARMHWLEKLDQLDKREGILRIG